MTHMTFIHGMANKPAADRVNALWLSALQRDDPRPDIFPSPNDGIDLDTYGGTSEMVYWADVLYEAPNNDESGYGYEFGQGETIFEGVPRDLAAAQPYETPLLETSLLPAEQLQSVERLMQQLGIAKEFPDDSTPSPEQVTRASQGDYALERIPLPWFIKKRIMKILLRDVHHYPFNLESNPRGNHAYWVRDELRGRLIEVLQRGAKNAGPHILLSHSMGTILAYDVLRNCPECPQIDHLITLGSPLGLDEVQDKIKHPGWRTVDFPGEKLRGEWINIFDRLDPVAGFDPFFANDYLKGNDQAVKDIPEQNWGDWRHSIQKYLSGPKLRGTLRRLMNI
jgi:hypothetical protein